MKFLSRLLYLIFITTIAYILVNSAVKNIIVHTQINNFKKSCVINNNLSDEYKKFYHVSRETETSLSYENGIIEAGVSCDIMINLNSSFTFPILHEVLSFTIGGHAALNAYDYDDFLYEITKNNCLEVAYNELYNKVFYDYNDYWHSLEYTNSYIVLRVNLTEEEKKIVFNKMVSMLGDDYNLTFLLNQRENHYCSDLLTKAFKEVGINLNQDGFITTMYDIITSRDTKIVMYKEYDKQNGIENYYYVS